MADEDIERISIHEQTKGSLGQTEDWWVLTINTKPGEKLVEYNWSHTNPYDPGRSPPPGAEGTRKMSVEEFLSSPGNETARSKLRDLLKRQT
jgi:hypothetical protein